MGWTTSGVIGDDKRQNWATTTAAGDPQRRTATTATARGDGGRREDTRSGGRAALQEALAADARDVQAKVAPREGKGEKAGTDRALCSTTAAALRRQRRERRPYRPTARLWGSTRHA